MDNWRAVTDHLMDSSKFAQIAPANRAQLIDDAMNLARGSYLSYDTAMNLTRYLAQETNHVPWKAATTNFYFIDSMFLKSPDYDILKVCQIAKSNSTLWKFINLIYRTTC